MKVAATPPLHLVRPPDPLRTQGGEIPDPHGTTWPYARLTDAAYAIRATGWRLAPVLHSERAARAGATEKEQDWRVYLVGEVLGACKNTESKAGSDVTKHLLDHGRRPLLCITFRVAVGSETGTRRIPRSGRLAKLWELIGHRGEGWSPEIADQLIGWRFEMQTYTQTQGRARREGQKAPKLPKALHRTWGEEILEASPPERAQ
jgi:hypothetical protein